MGIERETTIGALNAVICDAVGKDVVTVWTVYPNIWFSIRISISSKNIVGEKVYLFGTVGAFDRFHPKIIKHIANVSLGVVRLIKETDAFADA